MFCLRKGGGGSVLQVGLRALLSSPGRGVEVGSSMETPRVLVQVEVPWVCSVPLLFSGHAS